MAKEIDKSLGDQNTLQGAKPAESAQRSLRDRSTFGGSGSSSMAVRIVREHFMRYCLPLALISIVIATYAADPSKSAVPDEASQKETLSQIQAIYKADYEKAKTASQKLEMAQKMLKEADGTKDDAVARFVLLRVARDIAAQQGDVATALLSIDRIADAYEVDAVAMKIDAAKTALKVIKTPVDHQRSLEQLLPLVDSLLESEQYDAAKIVANMALSNARGTRDANTLKAIAAKVKEIDDIVARYEKVREYAAILEEKPTDATANLEVGRFRCFVRGDWERGIPMLALGDEESLKTLARMELEEKVDHLAAGDAWWEYGEAQSAIAKKQSLSHACDLYLRAMPQLSGLTKKRIEQRIATIQASLIKNSIGMPLKLIYPGTFTTGSVAGPASRTVQITRPYYIGVYEVTQEQYAIVMGHNPSRFKGANHPVEQVRWENAIEFCRRLSALPRERSAGRVYRLPTDAEWEYACRAGTTTDYSYGDDVAPLVDYAWFGKNANATTHPVGSKKPNPWGLYDMHGNVWEFCKDWYEENAAGDVTDPMGPVTGTGRVMRGGCWCGNEADCRSATRDRMGRSVLPDDYGFRVALSLGEGN